MINKDFRTWTIAAAISSFFIAPAFTASSSTVPSTDDPVYQRIMESYREVPQDEATIRKQWKKLHESKAKEIEAFRNEKFGMFIHWGIYAVHGGEYKGRTAGNYISWAPYTLEIPFSEYDQLARQFNPVNFNPDEWVSVAKEAGMQYMIITSKHHDGFALFDSRVNSFNMVQATPYKSDVIAMLHDACKKQDFNFGVYYSHLRDWRDGASVNPSRGGGNRNIKDWGDTAERRMSYQDYWEKKSFPQLHELLTQYPDMYMIWFDIGSSLPMHEAWTCYQMAYAYQPQLLCSGRIGGNLGDFESCGDNSVNLDKVANTAKKYGVTAWETAGTMNESWGFKKNAHWKSTEELLFWLVNIVSEGGCYTLNIGPKPDGTLDAETLQRLKEIGSFMKTNGDAIYGTEKWDIAHEGPKEIILDGSEQKKWLKQHGGKMQEQEWSKGTSKEDFWFTQKDGKIFAIGLVSPAGEEVLIKSLNERPIHNVSLLGADQKLSWEQTRDGLQVQLPETLPCAFGYALCIE